MPSKVDDLVLRIEAMLFASGKPLSVRELTEALDAPDFRPVQAALKKLARTYEGRQTSLEVAHVGDRYALKLRTEFLASAHPVTPIDLSPRTLKALTLIAYHQPVLQSLLVRMLGETTYEEVGRLRGLGLVHAESKGPTLELKTTKSFAEYFGIPSTRPEEIRSFLEQRLGISGAAAGPIPLPDIPQGVASDGSAPAPEPIPPEERARVTTGAVPIPVGATIADKA